MHPQVFLFSSLKIPGFRNYMFGAFISEVGNQMQTVAVAWQVYQMTKNPMFLGFIGVANFLPIILFSLIGGLVADKTDRKRLLILSQVAQSILALSLFLLNHFNLINLWQIYLILFLSSIAQSFSIPARQAVLPHLVPKKYFMNALSLATLQFQSATMVGPALAGFLIAGTGVGGVYFLNSISFVFFILAILSLSTPLQSHSTRDIRFNLDAVWKGVKFVFNTPILYTTMVLDFLATFFGTATILMPVFATDVLHVGASGLGFLYAAPAVGGIIAGLLIAALHHRITNQGQVIILSVVLYGIATIAFGLSKNFLVSIIFLIVVGFGDMVSTIIRNTIRQIVTPDHLRGRMASITRIFFQGGPQLGEIEAGFLAKAIGGPASVLIGGIGVIFITLLVAFRSKALRNYKSTNLNI